MAYCWLLVGEEGGGDSNFSMALLYGRRLPIGGYLQRRSFQKWSSPYQVELSFLEPVRGGHQAQEGVDQSTYVLWWLPDKME